MGVLHPGARQLPLRHISIRVPWNDTGWSGAFCQKPAENISCLILNRIRATRKDSEETALAGQDWKDLSNDKLPPCFKEHGGFMASGEITSSISHPYSENSKAHKHILPTPFRYAPYSAAAIPFGWMLRESAQEISQKLELGYQLDLEIRADEIMGFNTTWVQEKENQLVMLDTFFSAIQPQKSLVFFYAKRTPLSDDVRRVLVGVGWVTHVGDPVEYSYNEGGVLKSMIWERNIQHSIRTDFKDGFLLPYHAVLNYLETHPEEDTSQFVAFVPDAQFQSFSYGSEHVTNDGAIGSILACIKVVRNIQRIIPGNWDQILAWLDARLNELWGMRGPCPGLGSALTALGLENGSLIAYELEGMLAEDPHTSTGDPWVLVDQLFKEPETFPREIGGKIGKTMQNLWLSLPDERRALLKLLSRFELTAPQATRYFVHEEKQRSDFCICVEDSELISNPYRVYELDRFTPDPISLATIDRGVFPEDSIRRKYPLPTSSQVSEALDPRRVCAFVTHQLALAAKNGHTLQPRDSIIQEIRGLDTQPACPVNGDLMSMVESAFEPRVHIVKLNNNLPAYQLDELFRAGEKISSNVTRRMSGTRHTANIDWRELLANALKDSADITDPDEVDAQTEKMAALAELYASRFSVLIGSAGTGKTTLLKVLVHETSVAAGGVLLLAPTGKARVRMETQAELKGAQTIAQFLLPLGRYEPQTGIYHLSSQIPAENGFKTVVIDEASMLTEDQLAAVLDAVKGVDRLILVGDPHQLPPIGAGRPFLDIVQKYTPENNDFNFPRIGPGYAELTIRRRQIGEIRDDLAFAEWFSGRPLDPGADEIWQKIQNEMVSKHIHFIQWDTPDELQNMLLDTLVKELNLDGRDDSKKFELSLGGSEYKGYVFFWETRTGTSGASSKAEEWEILSPIRNNPFGVDAINRFIQSNFRSKTKEWASKPFGRKIPRPMGSEEILYGDKVIQTKNERRYKVYPRDNASKYVANGELGIVVGQYKTSKMNFTPFGLEVEFSSQPGFKYLYTGQDFGEEANPVLELAYALTIHKTQGSEFGLTFVIIPNPCRLLSRELLYTALTRQKNRVVVFHQGSLQDLKKYSDDFFSESAARLTNLLDLPKPVIVKGKFLEDKLIHRTRKGLCVRSKSEVIIASELDHAGIEYEYESVLLGQDGSVRYPDFMIDDSESGKRFYWEHLGMLDKAEYRRRWEEKLLWYRNQGIFPIDEGGGPHGSLITTIDHPNGAIDVGEIHGVIIKFLK